MKHVSKIYFTMLVTLMLLCATSARAQDECLQVGYHQFPGIIENGLQENEYTGLAYEILREVRVELGKEVCLTEYPDFETVIPAVEGGNVDLMLGGLTITAEREGRVDFTVPYMNAGVGILIPHTGGGLNFLGILKGLVNPVTLQAFAFLLGLIVLGGLILWMLERKDDRGIGNSLKDGIRDGIYCVEDSITTMGFGRAEPRTWLGRLLILVLFFIGHIPMGTISGQIASQLTVAELENSISSPDQLRGRTIATKSGTSSVELLRRLGATIVEVSSREDTISLLEDGKVEAVVYDAPYLKRVATQNALLTVSSVFAPQYYGFALPQGSPLREDVNRVLLRMWQDGSLEQATQKYFGD